MRATILVFIILYSTIFMTTPKTVIAGGTSFSSIFGTRTLSLNGLYIAGVDGLNSTWTNPAGLAFLSGRELNISLLDRMEQQEFDSPAGGLRRSFRNDNLSIGGGLFYNISPGLTAAVAYGKLIDYQVDWPYALYRRSDSLSAIAAFDFQNRLQVSAISPSVAVLFGSFAIGLTFDAYYIAQYSSFPVSNNRWAGGQGLVAYQLTLDQDAWSFGFNLGIMSNLTDNLRLGISVKSGTTTAKLKGSAKSQMFAQLDSGPSEVNLSGDFKLPWVFGLGIVYKLLPDLSVNLDAAYSLWKNIRSNYIFNFSDPNWQNSLSVFDTITGIQSSNFQFSADNSIDAGLGLEYGLPEQGFSYRFGYRFSQNPVSTTSYSLLFPGVDQHWISAGLGYKGENYFIDAGLAYVIGVQKDVNRAGIPELSGKYKTNNFIPSVTFRFQL